MVMFGLKRGLNSVDDSSALHADERLESWKEIAAFFGRGVRTVQRWEEVEGLPVHRHVHARGGTIFAYKSELEEWSYTAGLTRPTG